MNFHHWQNPWHKLKEGNIKKMKVSLRPADPLELELQATMLMWMLRTCLRSSGRAADALHSRAISSPKKQVA